MLFGALLAGCQTTSSQTGKDSGPDLEIPTVKVPIIHVGLQGHPTKWEDSLVTTVSNNPMPF